MVEKKGLKSYNQERHIKIDDAYSLLREQSINTGKLTRAMNSGGVRVYEFEGERYLDRLDIGRVYHRVLGRKERLTIERYFTDGKTDPFDSVGYENKDLRITDYKTGEAVFEMKDAVFPQGWDEVHAQIVAQKYFYNPNKAKWREKIRKKIGREHEYSPVHLIERVSNFLAEEGEKLGYFRTKEDGEVFRDELKWLQLHRKFAFNSPVYFNVGLYNEYGIEGGHGFVYWRDPETGDVEKIEDGCNKRPQAHACFICGPEDNLESIAMHSVHEIGIFSAGSGVGQDIGVLRGKGEPLSGGGEASGPLSFWKFYDDLGGTIKSGGKSRRAARLSSMRQHHQDVIDFIRSKVREDKKALALMKAGYSGGMDGEAYTTVTFQNTNISVRLDTFFFEQLEKGGEIELRRVSDGMVVDTVSADRMLKEIAFGAWRIGDPCVQYEDPIQEMHTGKNSGRINSSNPCTEYMYLNDTSCNLASINILAFCDEKGNLDIEAFRRASRLISMGQDILNDAASYPVRSIAEISPEFRTFGLGYANLGSWLMRRGIEYDSEEGRALAGAITALMTGYAYETSAEMAEKLGTFTHFEFNRKHMLEVMEKHQKNLEGIIWERVPGDLKKAAYESWKNVVKRGEEVGFRNAQATVLAPTGTISFLMGCETTGIEPSFSLVVDKNLAGGGNVTLINKEVENALKNLGYDENQIKEISAYMTEKVDGFARGTVIGAPHLNLEHYSIFNTAVGNRKGIGYIPFEGHVKMVAAAQPFISGAISKTNNLPENANVRDIYDGFLLGHKLGLKAMAVFRNNAKPISALSFGGKDVVELKRGEKEDLPSGRNAFESEVKIGGTPIHVMVSEYEDGRPGQIVFLSYKAGSTMGALLSTSGVQASKALKRGVGLEDVVEGWLGQEFEPKGIVHRHPFIKQALSPLDYAAKLLRLEYLGDFDMAEEKEGLELSKLRGYENGAFETYRKRDVDDWDYDQVIGDAELGGFVEEKEETSNENKNNGAKRKPSRGDDRGVPCRLCGRPMIAIMPGCWQCNTCGEKVGGCGG